MTVQLALELIKIDQHLQNYFKIVSLFSEEF